MTGRRSNGLSLWLKMALLVVVGAVVAAGLAIAWLMTGSRLPQSGQLELEGLKAPVTIRFDAQAVPYVEADSLDDAVFAKGFLHARERLWQMDLLRRAGNARLAELLGEDLLDTDEALWRAGVPDMRDQLAANASDRLLTLVKAYAGGVNAGIASLRQPPPEYLLARAEAAPWNKKDSFALGALMAFDSAGNHDREILRLALSEVLDAERLDVFLPLSESDPEFPYIWTAGEGEPGEAASRLDEVLAFTRAVSPATRPHGASIRFGSNGWVVAPGRSGSDRALFAFDSHDALGLPNLFYELHLFYGDHQLRGWSVPGLPGFINGFNDHLAWGFTNIGDSQDLVVLEADEQDPARFFDGSEWHRGRVEQIDIPVRGREPVTAERVLTRHGPLISDDPPLALRWTGQDIGTAGMDGLLEMNLASNAVEFDAAMARFPAPVSNVTWADTAGNIGFRTIGLLPIRRSGHGLLPVTDDGDMIWTGMVPTDEMPILFNPPDGFAAAANARVHDAEWPYLLSNDNAPGYRMRRIREVLDGRDDHDLKSVAALQTDVYNVQARRDLPRMLDLLKIPSDDHGGAAVALLDAWLTQPMNTADSAAALIFECWYLALIERLFERELGEALYGELLGYNYLVNHAIERLLDDPESPWWREDAEGIMTSALNDALDWLRNELGQDISTWRLDTLHHMTLRHEFSSAAPWLGRWLDRGPFPMWGGHATVGRAGYGYDRPFQVSHGATVRVVLEMDIPIRGRAVIPGGQSGHFISPHYANQIQSWIDGDMRALYPDVNAVPAAALELHPAQ